MYKEYIILLRFTFGMLNINTLSITSETLDIKLIKTEENNPVVFVS